MQELRWTLLILGVLFIAVLAWWERRRPHQASRPGAEPHSAALDRDYGAESGLPRVLREPTLTLPEIRSREPALPRELPVFEIADDSLLARRTDSPRPHAQGAQAQAPSPPVVPVLRAAEAADTPAPREPAATGSPAHQPQPHDPPPDEIVSEVRVSEARVIDFPPLMAGEPIVEWPADDLRRVLALRLVAPQAERFSGRAVRQALAAEGFLLGKFEIFHKPDEARRAVLSAASLTKPGTFDLESMDTQRYSGLNLFAVLPGPMSPPQAFDELLATARNLNERLQGALQDERGSALTLTRIATLRESLAAEAPS